MLPDKVRGWSDEAIDATNRPGGIYYSCKRLIHGSNYGGKAKTLAVACGWTVRETEVCQKRSFDLHPAILQWHHNVEEQLRFTRSVTNKFGYKRTYFDRVERLLPEALAWIPQCVPIDHEVLTLSGWKAIAACKPDEAIAVWNEYGKIVFEVPSSWYKGEASKLYNMKGLGYSCTATHRIPYFNAGRPKLQWTHPSLLPSGARIPRVGKYSGAQNLDKALLTYITAFQADGCYDKKRGSITFEFRKERKILRLAKALDALGIEYAQNIVRRGATLFYIRKKDALPLTKKTWGSWLLELDGDSLDYILEELEYWDGWRSPQGELWYSSSIKKNCEWMATIASLRNKRARWLSPDTRAPRTNYRITIAPNKGKMSACRPELYQAETAQAVACPTVSTGYFLLRHRDEIAVTGNSTVAHITERGMCNVDEHLPWVQLLLQVHDNVLMQIPLKHKHDLELIRNELSITVPYDDPLNIPWSFKTSSRSWGDIAA